MKRQVDWYLIVAAFSLCVGIVAGLLLWDWRFVVGGIVGALGSAMVKAAVEGADR